MLRRGRTCALFPWCDARFPSRKSWKESVMASGKVKWFDNKRGFGFIIQDQGKDVFVHHSSIQGTGYKTLQEGEIVNYELVPSEKGPKADKVQRVGN
jgi:CspA family cold shock protein